jgi:hypothetical protein
MSVGPGSSDSSAAGAVPFPHDQEHTVLGAYLRSLEDKMQAMAIARHRKVSLETLLLCCS